IVVGVRSRWGTMLLVGALGVVAGAIAFLWPGLTALALLYLIAAWAVVRGVVEIVAAIELRRVIEHEWILALAGATSVLFGVVLALYPGAGALSLVWLIGAFSIVLGSMLVALALRMRSRTEAFRHAAA
ncbi:MAG TPA: DUF308 domain-containing protein, partial [Planctomycetota bacterium]|nr:DUF308 domain-containing protein [Planctomycetota bacterium]